MPTGRLVQCRSHNNGEPLFPWERWFKKASKFLFQKNVLYTMVEQDNKIFVISRNYVPIEFDYDYFKILFKIK